MKQVISLIICSSLAVGVLSGLSSALFLSTLDMVGTLRESSPYFIYSLPVLGLMVVFSYQRFGDHTVEGSNGALKAYRDPDAPMSFRSGILIYVTTLLSHLGGASVGREGTAVQMSTSFTFPLLKKFIPPALRELGLRGLLVGGLAGGFGSVFGVPFAGAVFAIELLRRPKPPWKLLPWALGASLIGHTTVTLLKIPHTTYPALSFMTLEHNDALKLVGIALVSGFVARGYLLVLNFLKAIPLKLNLYLKILGFSIILLSLYQVVDPNVYGGLGIPIIEKAFSEEMEFQLWFIKLFLTAACLSFGFRGGEVTPLFFIGATLGSSLAGVLGAPIAFGAAVGFLGVFSGTLKLPLTTWIMGMELFGVSFWPFAFIAAFLGRSVAGKRELYSYARPTIAS
jgi:H+/Cl- antiporter ClcA